jgi:phage/plasmid-like protein (TIGR03299 family)
MSRETMEWLNANTLIGFTTQRGSAWHYRAEYQGSESNHYPGAVPIEDVRRRLFHWQAIEGEVQAIVLLPEGVATIADPTRKAIVRPDTQQVLGVFSKRYQIHQYDKWLLETVAELLDDDLSIGSAGLLRGGAVAWVSVEVPETITTPEGVAYRPHLLAAASHDGSTATSYHRCIQLVVCDNTMSAALRESEGHDQNVRVRHSSRSLERLIEAREALGIVHTIADDFAAEVAELTSVKVSDGDWARFLDSLVPVPDERGRARTNAEAKRETLNRIYRVDERAAPWQGTAWGVRQAVNTMVHHETAVRGATRGQRNMERAVTGEIDRLDRDTLDRLNAVLV